jgi:hypothetical protein
MRPRLRSRVPVKGDLIVSDRAPARPLAKLEPIASRARAHASRCQQRSALGYEPTKRRFMGPILTEALETGLVNAVHPDAEPDAAVHSWCDELNKRSPTAIALAKIKLQRRY